MVPTRSPFLDPLDQTPRLPSQVSPLRTPDVRHPKALRTGQVQYVFSQCSRCCGVFKRVGHDSIQNAIPPRPPKASHQTPSPHLLPPRPILRPPHPSPATITLPAHQNAPYPILARFPPPKNRRPHRRSLPAHNTPNTTAPSPDRPGSIQESSKIHPGSFPEPSKVYPSPFVAPS